MEQVKAKPASAGEIAIYLPYFPASRRQLLAPALGLYKTGTLEGRRRVEGSAGIPFVASWEVRSLPSDATVCRVRFIEGELFLDYELPLANTEFIGFLMEAMDIGAKGGGELDFPSVFFRRLLGYS